MASSISQAAGIVVEAPMSCPKLPRISTPGEEKYGKLRNNTWNFSLMTSRSKELTNI